MSSIVCCFLRLKFQTINSCFDLLVFRFSSEWLFMNTPEEEIDDYMPGRDKTQIASVHKTPPQKMTGFSRRPRAAETFDPAWQYSNANERARVTHGRPFKNSKRQRHVSAFIQATPAA